MLPTPNSQVPKTQRLGFIHSTKRTLGIQLIELQRLLAMQSASSPAQSSIDRDLAKVFAEGDSGSSPISLAPSLYTRPRALPLSPAASNGRLDIVLAATHAGASSMLPTEGRRERDLAIERCGLKVIDNSCCLMLLCAKFSACASSCRCRDSWARRCQAPSKISLARPPLLYGWIMVELQRASVGGCLRNCGMIWVAGPMGLATKSRRSGVFLAI